MINLFQHIPFLNYFHPIILTLVLVIFIIISQTIKNGKQFILANKIPGPKGYFIIGSTPIFTQGQEKILKKLKLLCKKYEYSIFKLWIFHKLTVVVSNAEDIEQVISSPNCFNKPIFHSVIQDTTGLEGLQTTNKKLDYKKNRKIVSGWLNYSQLKLFTPSFYEEAKVLQHVLSQKSNSKSFDCDINRAFQIASMGTIGRTALGKKFNLQNKEDDEFLNNTERLSDIIGYKLRHPWFSIPSLFSLSSKKKEQQTLQQDAHKYVVDSIQKKHVEMKEKAITVTNEYDDPDSACPKLKVLTEILLENEYQMSRKQMLNEILTIVFAGYETTAITNSTVIFMLAQHQDIQQNVFRECNSIFSTGQPDRPLVYEDLQKMEYLERVIKETMRFYPAAPILAREAENEMMIGKYRIPAGTSIAILVHCLHLSPEYYKDPEKFNPDNFLPEVCRNRHPFAYIPFSAGSRNCVGMKFAMLQMKTMISTLVRHYRFSPSEKCLTPKDLRVTYNVVSKFVDGCYVKIEPRT